MKAKHFLTTIMLTAFICLMSQAQHQHKQEAQVEKSQPAAKKLYSCPMHPEVVSDKPGKCHQCGMKLEKKAAAAAHSPESMMGKPAFEKSFDGVNLQVWLITQEEHKKIAPEAHQPPAEMKEHIGEKKDKGEMKGMDHSAMHGKGMKGMMHGKKEESNDEKDHHMMGEEMKHDGKEMNMEAMMAGTHHVMLMVTDEATKKEIEKAKAEITLTSPSKRISTVELMSMKNHFGGGLSMEEKGAYQLLAAVKVGEKLHTAQFDYDVK